MQTTIHPKYFEAKVTCACGNEFTVGSTKPEIHVEICANCHPFYTGKQKLVDTAGRVDRFKELLAKKQAAKKAVKKPVAKAAPVAEAKTEVAEEKPAKKAKKAKSKK